MKGNKHSVSFRLDMETNVAPSFSKTGLPAKLWARYEDFKLYYNRAADVTVLLREPNPISNKSTLSKECGEELPLVLTWGRHKVIQMTPEDFGHLVTLCQGISEELEQEAPIYFPESNFHMGKFSIAGVGIANDFRIWEKDSVCGMYLKISEIRAFTSFLHSVVPFTKMFMDE